VRGALAAGHPLTAQADAEALEAGGNAASHSASTGTGAIVRRRRRGLHLGGAGIVA
jgi:gamma-glutamyltranspeptidase